jgi:anaerobic selenocysteine-containing dehydrogenase
VRSEVEIIADIASGIVGDDKIDFSSFKKHSHIREAISETIPGFENMKTIDETKEEFQIPGRTFHTPEFATLDKKANFSSVQIPKVKGEKSQFRMASIRSEGQFNTIIYEEFDSFRNVDNRWIVLMNKDDMDKMNLSLRARVNLENKTGKMENVWVKPFNIPQGNVATYYPESNVLIPTENDSQSKTPGFKSVVVTIEYSVN